MNNDMTTSVANGRHCAGKLFGLMVALQCLAAATAFGKTFTLDLRAPSFDKGVRAFPALKNETAATASEDAEQGMLRRVNLDAGVTDVGALAVGDELSFTLFDDVRLTVTLARRMESPLGGDSFLGEVKGYDGIKNAVVLRTEDGLTVDIQDYRANRVYSVISSAEGVTVREFNPTAGARTCTKPIVPNCPAPSCSAKTEQKSTPPLRKKIDGATYVDVLVAYDSRAKSWVDKNGGITNFASVAVQKMNTALANTGLDADFAFRLIDVMAVSASGGTYVEGVVDYLQAGIGEWSAVVERRNQVGADIVTLLIDTGSAFGSTGIGFSMEKDWLLTESDDVSWFADYAYNVCAIRSVVQSHTMTHEVGHNMGAGHSDEQATSPGPQLYKYSSGFYFKAKGQKYGTIMTYENEGPGGVEAPYFSSPNYTYEGTTVGDALHDNTRTLRNTFATVAKFRSADDAQDIGEDAQDIDWGGGDDTPLTWLTSRADVLAAAKATGRRIFLIYGRDTCGNTMGTKNGSCEDPEVKAKLAANYVLWYSNCDTQSDESARHFYGSGYSLLPFVAIIDLSDPDGYVVRTNGYQTVSDLLALLAQAEGVPSPDVEYATVTFDANGGEVYEKTRQVIVGKAVGALPEAERDGYYFDGWFTARTGGKKVDGSLVVTKEVTLFAHWSEPLHWYTTRASALVAAQNAGKKIFLVCGRETCGNTIGTRDYSCEEPEVRARLAQGCVLWFNDVDTQMSEVYSYLSGLGSFSLPLVCIIDPAKPQNYIVRSTGYLTGEDVLDLLDQAAIPSGGDDPDPVDEEPTQVKWTVTFNLNGAPGTTPSSRSVQDGAGIGTLPSVPEWKGHKFLGWFTAASGGTPLTFSTKVTNNMTCYAHWEIQSVFVLTNGMTCAGIMDASFARAQTIQGALFKDGEPAGTMQLKVGKLNAQKQTVKVSATATLIVDGKMKKVSARAVNLSQDNGTLRDYLTFNAPIGRMQLAMSADGTFTLSGGNYEVVGAVQENGTLRKIPVGGSLSKSRMSFTVVMNPMPDFGYGWDLLDSALPEDEPVMVVNGGTKWSFRKAATLSYKRFRMDGETWFELTGLDNAAKPNLSALKLTYTAKTGIFKGTFKLYATNEDYVQDGKSPKVKKYTVNVSGLVVDGMGIGEAVCKSPVGGPWSATVE